MFEGSVVLASGPPATGFANAAMNGLVTGSVVTLGAIGLALVYSIAEVPNFAHGELLTLGAYFAFLVNKPSVVPLLDNTTTGEQSLSTVGLIVLFVISSLAFLAVIYHLGGDDPFSGNWWSYDVSPWIGYTVHGAIAILIGGIIVISTPSIVGGMLFAALSLGAVAPVFDSRIFRKFRERGDDLATLLIVALGLSFVLRFGIQAVFGGEVKSFVVPEAADVAGILVPLSAAQDLNFYRVGSGIIVQHINTRPDPAVTTTVVEYGWMSIVILLVVPLLFGAVGYRWRGAGTGFTSGQTIGPRLTGTIAWIGSLAVLLVLLPVEATVPETYLSGTQVSVSVLRLSTLFVAIGMIGFLHVLLKETKLGVAMRAASDNLDLAKVTGINTRRVMMTAWIIAGAYSAIAGVMAGMLFFTVTPNLGFFRLLPIFAGVILGGVSSVYGAVVGSYVVGMSMELGIFWLDLSGIHRVTMAFLVLIVVLLIKPEGLVGGS